MQHIIATQVGERDEQAPDSLEDTLYWVVLKRTQTESPDYKCLGCSFCLFDVACVPQDSMYPCVDPRINQSLSANCKPGTAFFDAPVPGPDPGLLSKKAPATQSAPLKADVLRAHDQRREQLSQIAANAVGAAGLAC